MKPNPLFLILFSFPFFLSSLYGQDQLPIYVFSEKATLFERPQLNSKPIATFAFGDTLYFDAGDNGSECYHMPPSKYIEDINWYLVRSKSGIAGWVHSDDVSINMKVSTGKHHQVVFQSFCGDGMPSWRIGRVYDTNNKPMAAFADSIGFRKGLWINQDRDFIFSGSYSLWHYGVFSKTLKRISVLHGDFLYYKKTTVAYIRTTYDCPANATIRFGILDTNNFVMHDLLTIDAPKYSLDEGEGEGGPNYAFSLIRKDGIDYAAFQVIRFSVDHYEAAMLYVNFDGVIVREEVLYRLR